MMTKRDIGIYAMLLLAAIAAFGWGWAVTQKLHGHIYDYRLVDFGVRCLIHHCDVYSESDMTRFYLANGGERTSANITGEVAHYLAGFQPYPPSAEMFFAPFAIFSWPVSYVAWISLSLLLLTTATFLMWSVAHTHASDLPFYLAWFLLANSGGLLAGGNPAAVAVSLAIIGVWSIFQNRIPIVGVVCLAASLAIKPHDSGFVWLFLLCVGGAFRKRAVQSVLLTILFAITGILWVRQVSPDWIHELRSNLATLSSNGSCNDPAGPAALSMVNLQTVFAVFWNSPKVYNLLSFTVCAPLILIFFIVALRLKPSPKAVWLGLATIATLSMLPVYHRPYDAKILLLTLPACAMLWAERGLFAWTALLLTAGGIVSTSDLPVMLLQAYAPPRSGSAGSMVIFLLTTRPAPFILLAQGVFYLCAFVQHYRAAKQNHVDADPYGFAAERVLILDSLG